MTDQPVMPEKIWAQPPETFDDCDVWVSWPDPKATPYTREDVAQAMVAAALGEAADFVDGAEGERVTEDLCARIRVLITPDALSALDRVKAEAREQERRAIFDRITEYIDRAPCDGINAEGEFSEAVWLSQRKFIDGMRQGRAAATPRAEERSD